MAATYTSCRFRPILLWLITAMLSSAATMSAHAQDQPAPTQPAPAKPPASPEATPKPAQAKPAENRPDDDDTWELVVRLRDGRRFTGPVVKQDATEVVIRIAGIPTRFATEEIERLEVLEPLMERYKKLREAVGDDPDQIVRLAEWLQAREKYELALTEVNRALVADKNHGPSIRLKAMLEQQIILKHNRVKKDPAAPDEPENRVDPAKAAAPPAQRPADFPLLSTENVNLIKVYETNFDERPRIRISHATITKVLDANAGHPLVPITREGREAIMRQTPAELLDLMFKLQARQFYTEVEVDDQPRAFVVFRDHICRTWLLNSCSTTMCHGGTEAGRLVLYNHLPNAERTVYTNFLILSRYQTNDGAPLINWDQPERSPLLQAGLPRDKARRPHPEVPRGIASKDAWKPVFRSTEDPQFKAAVEWIKSLYRPRPDYPIVYTPAKPFEPVVKPQPVPVSPGVPVPPVAPNPAAPSPPATPPEATNPAPKPTTDSPSTPSPGGMPEPMPR